MNFRITGLPAEHFAHLFDLSDGELASQGAVRRIADGARPVTHAGSVLRIPHPEMNCCLSITSITRSNHLIACALRSTSARAMRPTMPSIKSPSSCDLACSRFVPMTPAR